MGRYEHRIPEIKEKIVREINPEKIVLFGSYAWGKPDKDSDVDFFIIQKSNLPRRQRQIELRKKLYGSGVPMDLLIYTPEELQYRLELEDFFFKKIIKEGKELYAK
ncbi:MAG: nucleotidyltransferase domain-containing protein [bacterium]|nr:nucleotidyltransferase domain-containing protein [bacterium]